MGTTQHFKTLVLASLCTILLATPGVIFGRIIYVDDDAEVAQDGSSWAAAIRYLRDALAGAQAGDEIRVAQGTYYPDEGAPAEGERQYSLFVPSGVTLKGGFAGPGATDPNQCDPVGFPSILSGDFSYNDPPVPRMEDLATDSRYRDNFRRVVVMERPDANTVLDGFTICGAHAYPTEDCGGLYLDDGSPQILNCSFVGNAAAGLWIQAARTGPTDCKPFLRNCRFERNITGLSSAAHLGGDKVVLTMHQCRFVRNGTAVDFTECEISLSECHFTDNGLLTQPRAGGIHGGLGHVRLHECVFSNNRGPHGACIDAEDGTLEATRCLFLGNRAAGEGGCLRLMRGGTASFTNCVFAGNRAGERGGAVASSTPDGRTIITNSIFWNNEAPQGPQLYLDEGPLQVQYCDVQGGAADVGVGPEESVLILEWGFGNIDSDPAFVDGGHWSEDAFIPGDYHLLSEAGRWHLGTQSWVADDVTSPCIDAGDPNSPVGEEPFPNGERVNIGVYGGTQEASMSPAAGPMAGKWSEPVPLAEVNLDDAEEWAPVLSADSLTLYFGRVNGPESDLGRIFQATRPAPTPDSPFASIIKLPGTLNHAPGHVLCPWVSPDGLRLYYNYQTGSTFRLMVSERAADSPRWMTGTVISELNQLSNRLITCRLTSDELTIFFGGPDQRGAGAEYDIWMATRPDRHAPFGAPVNMEGLNSPANDLHASPSADGLSLYFASKRSGPYQLFRSTRESRNAPFGPPVHLPFFDTPNGFSMFPYLSPDGKEFYFMRQTGADRSARDIWVSYRLD
jgi:predicted outer membrane repeat protein